VTFPREHGLAVVKLSKQTTKAEEGRVTVIKDDVIDDSVGFPFHPNSRTIRKGTVVPLLN
jgi:hypothetical protein